MNKNIKSNPIEPSECENSHKSMPKMKQHFCQLLKLFENGQKNA